MADNSNTLTLTLQVKDDGSVIVDTTKGKIDALNQSTVSGGKSVTDVLGGIKAGWLAVAGGATAAYLTVKQFLDAASEAEAVESRVAFGAEKLGYDFGAIKPYVDSFADSMMKASRVSDELAREGLAKILEFTPDIERGMEGVRLAADMEAKKFGDLEGNIRLVGMAMNGNVEILGRWVPELRDLDGKLGSTATNAEKAEYALKVLNEKFGGAAAKDIQTYSGQVAQLKNQYDELKEAAGRALMPVAKLALQTAKGLIGAPSLFSVNIPTFAEIAAQDEAKRKANEQAKIASATKAYDDDIARWNAAQDQRQAINFQFAAMELQIKKNTIALIDAEEFVATEKAKKYGADISQIKNVYHLKRLDQIKKEKEEEQNAMLSLATMWKGYYDDRISKENEIISLIKGTGIETTVGAKFEFAGVEEQFRKVFEHAAKNPTVTKEELEGLKAAYIQKVQGILPFQGGEWEDIPVVTGTELGREGLQSVWGTDKRWKPGMMGDRDRQIEAMREESMRRIEGMSAGVTGARPEDIISRFDETRNRVVELQQEIDKIREIKLEVESGKLLDTIKQARDLRNELADLSNQTFPVNVVLSGDLIGQIESQLSGRITNRRSTLGPTIRRESEGVYGNE